MNDQATDVVIKSETAIEQPKPEKPNYQISFKKDNDEIVGVLDFNGPFMKFQGNLEESAAVFISFLGQKFEQRLMQERQEAVVNYIESIVKEKSNDNQARKA
jgi:hypothetical protein